MRLVSDQHSEFEAENVPPGEEGVVGEDGIRRRDFLDGAAIGAAGLAVASAVPGLTGAEAALAAKKGGGKGKKKAAIARPKPLPKGYYPPKYANPKVGQPDKVVKRTMKIDGEPISDPDDIRSTAGGPGIERRPRAIKNTGETFDCVIVGCGLSGLASAKFYRDRFGPDAKILLVDALPDFGGHAKRNEFHIPDATNGGQPMMYLRNGGVVNLDSIHTWNEPTGNLMDIPGEYGQPAIDMLDWAGVDYEDDSKWERGGAESIPSEFGLRQFLLFGSKDFDGTDYCIPARNQAPFDGQEGNNPAGWQHFLDRTPYSRKSKQSILDVQTTDQDWLADAPGAPLTQAQKIDYLTRITYKRYLTHHVGVTEEAFYSEYWRGSGSLLGTGGQAVGAADCWMLGRPGFPDALGLPDDTTDIVFSGIGRTPQMGAKTSANIDSGHRAWPDGNTSLVRLIVSKLIPQAFAKVDGARPNQLSIVKANCDYSQLDRRGRKVKIRLNSHVYRVKPRTKGDELAYVEYLQKNGKARRVAAKHVVMACWNRVTAQVVDGLPESQKKGLDYARKVPIIYGRAGIKNWKAWADAKISSVNVRGETPLFSGVSLSAGGGFGPEDNPVYGPNPANDPNQPATLSFSAFPNDPDAFPQTYAYETGRRILLGKTFKELEEEVIEILDKSLNQNGGDFDPKRDVHTWQMNRWNYGYAHEFSAYTDPSIRGPFDQQPQRKGCVPFRNVAIGNSDSQAMAYTHSAFQEGHRAVQDLPG